MLAFGVILVVLGALAIVAGALMLGTLGVSLIFFGILSALAGGLLFASNKSAKLRSVVKKIVGMKEVTLIIILAIVVYIFWVMNNNFLSPNNLKSIFNSAFVMGAIAVGMGCLLISGKLDLSAGSTGMIAGVIIAFLLRDTGIPWVIALILTLLFGGAIGLVNAFFVNVLGFAAFISTLAIGTVLSGLALVMTNAQSISIGNQSFWKLGSANIFGIIPLPFFIMIVLFIIYGIMLSQTGFGRRIYMVGGNPNAARLAGINPKRVTTILFVNNSVIAAFAGIVMASRMHSGSPSAVTGTEMDAITAAVLGGIAYTGGTGNMVGAAIGALLIAFFQSGLTVVGLDSYYQVVAKGILLIAALILDYYREQSRIKALNANDKIELTA